MSLEMKTIPERPADTSAIRLDVVHHGDCVEGMRRLPDRCVDVAIADPPYNASKGGVWRWDDTVALPGFGGPWAKTMAGWDDMPLGEYLRFALAWLSELKRVVRPTGSLWVHGTYHNIGIINFALQLLEIEIINEVVWYKANSFPNLSGRRLTASHETILWAHTGKRREYLFEYEKTKQMACPEDDLRRPGKQMRTVWSIANNKGRDELRHGRHPTQKPVRLLRRMLAISSRPGQTCLVPFAGAGSECVAARAEGLRFVAFETEREYVDIAERRLRATARPSMPATRRSVPSLLKWSGSKRSQASVIASHMPDHRRYFEPFLGGGAVLYHAAGVDAMASDLYAPLIAFWRAVRDEPARVVAHYAGEWRALQANLPGHYYAVRDRFNRDQDPLDLGFLTRTCVNGIARFNEAGAFNNSFHLSRPGMHPDRFARVVAGWSEVIRDVTFECLDYEAALADATEDDFAYLDPPYAGNRQRYIADLDLERFFAVLGDLNRRGVGWALSFDGRRGGKDLSHPVPEGLYTRRILLSSGNSAVGKVLNGPIEAVHESLYLSS